MSRTEAGRIRAREIQPSTVHRGSRYYEPLRYVDLVPDEGDGE